jgi:hypothetical protein
LAAGTYTAGSALPKDDMRSLCGDVEAPFLLSDDEVLALYDATQGRYSSAATVCTAMAARLASLVDTGAEGAFSRLSQRAEAMRKLAEDYRKRALVAGEAGAVQKPYAPADAAGTGGMELVEGDPQEDAWHRYRLYHPGDWPRC